MIDIINWEEYPEKVVSLSAENLNKMPKSFIEKVFEETSTGVFDSKVKEAIKADYVGYKNATTIDGVPLSDIFEEDGKTFKRSRHAIYAENSKTALRAKKADHADIAEKLLNAQEKLYDITIKTQEEFSNLIASSNWLGAQSVLFVGDGGHLVFSTQSNTLSVPNTVKRIKGVNSVLLSIGTTEEASYFRYKENISNEEYSSYSIEGIELEWASFMGFVNMKNCRGSFLSCNYIDNCFGWSSTFGWSNRRAFSECKYISNSIGFSDNTSFYRCDDLNNCSATGEKENTVTSYPQIIGFHECLRIINSKAIVSNKHPEASAYGFSGCGRVLNCSAKATTVLDSSGSGIGYNGCNDGSNNRDLGSTTSPTAGTTGWPAEINDK